MVKESFMEYAYNQIKQGIFDGTYKKDQFYSTQYFAKRLNISRTPVREALLQLRDENLIEIFQNRGVMIKEISKERLYEITQIRCAVDGYCASYMAENIHSAEGMAVLVELKSLCQQEEALLEKSQDSDADEQWYALDSQFHHTLNSFADNPTMLSLLKSFEDYIRYVGIATAGIKDRKGESVAENYIILEAIETGDPSKAFMAAKAHVEQIYLNMLLCLS